jgi:Spy/CpxP family protein refolding chaperone
LDFVTNTTLAQRDEIRALARRRIELRYQRDLMKLQYAELYDEHKYKQKPRAMIDLATQIDEIDEQLREVETPKIQERFNLANAQVANICSGRLALRTREF